MNNENRSVPFVYKGFEKYDWEVEVDIEKQKAWDEYDVIIIGSGIIAESIFQNLAELRCDITHNHQFWNTIIRSAVFMVHSRGKALSLTMPPLK